MRKATPVASGTKVLSAHTNPLSFFEVTTQYPQRVKTVNQRQTQSIKKIGNKYPNLTK
jgi:hypothetical protein